MVARSPQQCRFLPQMNTEGTENHQNSAHSCKAVAVCIAFIFAIGNSTLFGAELKTVDDFRAGAAKANAVLTIPDWEQAPGAIEAGMKNAINKANADLDEIGKQDLSK